MGETNNNEIWKRLFHVLFNNKVADEELPNIWAKFKKENLHKSDIRTAIESFKDHLHKDVRKRLNESSEGSADEVSLLASSLKDLSVQYQIPNEVMDKLCDLRIEETGAEASILSVLRESSLLDNDFWRLLFTDIRDREVEVISEEKRIPILEGGQVKHMSMADIEQKFILENPDLLTAQRCIPAKEKYLLYDENGEPLDLRTKVDEYVQDCSDCSERVPEPDELLNIPKALEEKVFLFADRKHKGFAEAYSRVKSWAVFPDFKRKVLHLYKQDFRL